MRRRQPYKERKKEPPAEGTGVHGTYGGNGAFKERKGEEGRR